MPQQRSAQRLVATVVFVAASLLVVVSGCATAPASESVATPPSIPPAASNGPNLDSLALLRQAATPPTTLTLAELGIEMPVESHGLASDGQMSLPVSPFTAGWYAYGSAPDSIQGATVIAAHVDSIPEGKGPFSRLRDAQVGMTVTVSDSAGVVHTYRVTAVERIAKAEVPLERVFTAVGAPHLVLVTCGGEFDRQAGSYKDNYIVTAEKVS